MVFAVLAPLSIFYARGYIINTKDGSIIKTGIISLETNVSPVSFIVDGKQLGTKNSPILIKNLTPGSYHVELKKAGFKDWQADLPVVAEKVSRLDNILMFVDKPTTQSPITGQISAASVSPNAKYTVFALTDDSESGIWMHTSNKDKNRQLIKAGSDPELDVADVEEFRWSNNSRAVLIRTKPNDYYFLYPHVARPTLIPLKNLHGLPPADIVLNEDEPSTIFFTQKNDLFRWQTNLSDQAPKKIASRIKDFQLVSPKLFVLQESKNGDQNLASYDLRSPGDGLNVIASLPKDQKGVKLQVSSGRHVALTTKNGDLLLLKKPDRSYVWSTLDHGVDSISWSLDGRYLIFNKNTEIWAYDQDALDDQPTIFLVTRLAGYTREIKWHPGSNYVLISFENDSLSTSTNEDYFLLYISRLAPQMTKFSFAGIFGSPQMAGSGDNFFYLKKVRPKDELVIYPITKSK